LIPLSSSLAALLCVCGIALGQLLFKCTADSVALTGSYLHPTTARWLITALGLYGITTFGWIWTLQQGSLTRLYPWMALAFVLVPLLSALVLGERLTPPYWLGVGLIVLGVSIAVRS
jgi:uncharacterized membrane protein